MQTAETAPGARRGIRKVWQGKVVSDKMDKTVVVAVERLVRHPLYGRTMRRTTRFKAHDEANAAHTGDTVEIVECRPISKDKCFRVTRVVERAK
jgi:small subunit ribosomal protein S17